MLIFISIYRIYTYICNRIILQCYIFVRIIQNMSHLHDFVGATGPQKILMLVNGPFLKIIE